MYKALGKPGAFFFANRGRFFSPTRFKWRKLWLIFFAHLIYDVRIEDVYFTEELRSWKKNFDFRFILLLFRKNVTWMQK